MRRGRGRRVREHRRGIYILPNIFTTGNLFCGFFSIIAAMTATPGDDRIFVAGIAIIFAGVFDLLDGRIARMTHTASAFGLQFDSMADLTSFGLAPAILMYQWALRPFGRLGWLAAFLYFACGALRLARFNVQDSGQDKLYFKGLPIPVAATIVSTSVLLQLDIGMSTVPGYYYIIVCAYCLAFLMVSTIPYRSFKELDLRERKSFRFAVLSILVLIVVVLKPILMLFVTFAGYAVFGIVEGLLRMAKQKEKEPVTQVRREPGEARMIGGSEKARDTETL